MAIVYDPKKLLNKIAPDDKIAKLIKKGDVSLKKTALKFVDQIEFLDKKAVAKTALKTIKDYRKRIKDDGDIKTELLSDPKQLIQRVQNSLVFQVSQEIKSKYKGERYEWLPSDADEPDPEHQLNYGKIFFVGEGEMPNERIGCRCGMRILVNETELELG